MRKIATLGVAFSLVFGLSGATYYYIGPESATYSDFSNWADANGVQPTTFLNNTLVFTNDAPVTLEKPSNASNLAASKIQVTKADVIFKNPTSAEIAIRIHTAPMAERRKTAVDGSFPSSAFSSPMLVALSSL